LEDNMLDDVKSTLFNITRNVGKTSNVFIKTAKLSVTLSQEQEALKTLYIEIGKKVHEIYQYGGSLGKFFDEKYRELESQERKITDLKDELAKIKGVKDCPKCGKQVDKNAEFCPKCGLRLDGVAAVGEAPSPYGAPPGMYGAASTTEAYAAAPVSAPPIPSEPAGYVTASPIPAVPAGYASTPPISGEPTGYASASPIPAEPTGYAASPPASETPPYPAPSSPYAAAPSPAVTAPPIPTAPAAAKPTITLSDSPPPAAALPAITAAPPPTVKCRACGAENDKSTKFCLSCGRIL
jgi:hypothetical protein